MKTGREIGKHSLDAMRKAGLEKCECRVRFTRKDELNVDGGRFSLLRSTDDVNLFLSGIVDGKRGTLSINGTDADSIDEAAGTVMEMACSSETDSANDISPKQPPRSLEKGPDSPNLNLMYSRMQDFIDYSGTNHPSLILEQLILDFTNTRTFYMNSNGVDLASRTGRYTFFPMFTSKEGTDTSSFNYTGVSSLNLEENLHELGNLRSLMKQSTEQVRSRQFNGKFIGDVIITPDCLEDFLSIICMYLSDYHLIKGTSIFKDSLGEPVASRLLTLHSMPLSDELASGYHITSDGFAAENSTIIGKGVLNSFLLSLYGANKTGHTRSLNNGGALVIEPGDSSLAELIGSVEKGVLLCRFSGGMPSESGDFSGVAKNSYTIEKGKIGFPAREIMISGNIRDMLMNISGVSKERVNSGGWLLPWIVAGGLSVFGK